MENLGYGSFGVAPHCLACLHLRPAVYRGKVPSFHPQDKEEVSDSKAPLKGAGGFSLGRKEKEVGLPS